MRRRQGSKILSKVDLLNCCIIRGFRNETFKDPFFEVKNSGLLEVISPYGLKGTKIQWRFKS